MARLSDRLVSKAVHFLRDHPAAHRLVRKHLAGTVVHRIAQEAVRGVNSGAAPISSGPASELAGHWDRNVARVESKELKGWLDWEFIEIEHIRPQVSGDKAVYYLQHFFRNHLPNMPVDRALSLGCGGGNLERALIQLGAARTIDAFDASAESIRLATELAGKEGLGERIRYAVADLDRLSLEAGAYDFVVAKMSLHHFERLDHIYGEVRRALRPGGVFMFNEYVGPTRFQWTDLQLRLVNELLQLLPREHRRSALSGEVLAKINRPTLEEMIKMDPTEAVRSEDIIPALSSHFEVLEQRGYGGTLLHLLLNHVMPNFDLEDELQVALLRTIFLLERTLVEQKVLASDFCFVVARPLPLPA